MRSFIHLVATLLLLGCSEQPAGTAGQTFTAVGTWSSPDGFQLTVREDGRYRFCDRAFCAEETYETARDDYIVLRNFFTLQSTRRFIKWADAPPPCGSGKCGVLQAGITVNAEDLEFIDTVALVDRARKCGTRLCTIIGNVEVARGTLYKE